MDKFYLIFIGFLFGALVAYGLMQVKQAHEKRKADFERRLKDLEEQINGKQLPYFVRDGLEDIKALENKDTFDLARLRLYLEEAIKTVDQAASRQNKMSEVYDELRNPKNRRKGDKQI